VKRGICLVFEIVFLLVFSLAFVSGAGCVLNSTLINQDPYPAVPGDYVKVVFQLNGLENPACGIVKFRVIEEFPFSLDSGVENEKNFNSGTYVPNYDSFAMIPYKIRVNKEALNGANVLGVAFSTGGTMEIRETFEIEVQEVNTDFEVSIKDYVKKTNIITFEILNIGESNAEAVTIEIPKQDNLEIKGTNRDIAGSLDSNEDTTSSFEAIPKDGEIKLNILYTDEVGNRRQLQKSVYYDSSYFDNRIRDLETTSTTTYVIIVLVVVIIIWIIIGKIMKYRRKKRFKI
jgi:hypothetical protein